jgi:hypothetical protein
MAAGVLAGDRQLVLYMGAADGADLTLQVFASTDGGNHWSAIPSAGLGTEYPVGHVMEAPIPDGSGAVLADGALLESFSGNLEMGAQGTCVFYAWTPGQSQVQPIGAQLSGVCASFLLVPAGPGGPGSLWVVYTTGDTLTTPANTETA